MTHFWERPEGKLSPKHKKIALDLLLGVKSKVSRRVILKKILFWSITRAFKSSSTKTYPQNPKFFLIQIEAHDVSVNLAAHRSRVIGFHPTIFHHMIRVGSPDLPTLSSYDRALWALWKLKMWPSAGAWSEPQGCQG